MKCQKCSVVAGILLFVLAALFSISLLLVAVDFGQISPAKNTIFYTLGKMFTGVYGFTSICIPIFLIVAGIQCFNAKWRLRNGVLLIGSIIPFFTLDAIEHICRMIVANDNESVMIVKMASTLLIGALILAAEYLLLSILGDVIENSIAENAESKEFFKSNDTEPFNSDENAEDDEIIEDDEDPVFDGDEIEPAKKRFFSHKAEPKEDELDLSTDRIFLQQKEILKDLINDSKPNAESEKPQEDETVIDEPTIVEHADFEDAEAIPESVTEDEILEEDDFVEPELPEEPSPFDHIFEKQEEPELLPAEDSKVRDIALPDEEIETISTDEVEPIEEIEEELEEPVAAAEEEQIIEEPLVANEEDTIIEEPEISVNSEDFQDEFDDMNDVSPLSSDEPEEHIYENLSEEEDEDFYEDIPDALIENEEPEFEDEHELNEIQPENLDEEIIEEPAFESEPQFEPEEDIADNAEDDTIAFNEETVEANFDSEPESEELSNTEPVLASEEEPEPEPEIIEYPEDETSEEFVNIDDIAENQSEPVQETSEDEPFETEEDEEEPLGVEDIFSQMEADAAANPVVKNPEEFAANANLQQNVNSLENDEKPAPAPIRKFSQYIIPTDLLEKFENAEYWRVDDETKAAGENLKQTLNEFGIEAEVTGIRKGPVVTMFELLPAPGVKLSKIVNLQDNIALALAAKSVRIVAPIPGKHAVGIEIPNKERAIVSFREIIEQPLQEYKKMAIPVILGKDISGQSQIIDIAKTPHLLIAGATGAGKSVCVNSIILSILYNRSPNDVKLIMVDPKVVELKLYNDIPHLLTPVVTEPKRALQVLQYCICEMERRYALLDGMGVRDIVSYNTRIRERRIATEKLPYIVVIIDEFADLMATSGKELETSVARLTAMSRAVGIHLVLATQRPSVNVITGLIKANIPSRIAFMVASRTDSNIIIDSVGAEKLLGKGDMLYTSAVNPIPTRIQGTLVSDNEVENVVDYVKTFGGPDYIDDEIFVDDDEDVDDEPGLFSDGEDPLYDQALQIVIQAGKASASYIQRRLKIGYNRAARLVEDMEARGIVGPANGSKPREVIHVP